MKINQEDSIKIYLRIKTPKIIDKPYYNIDLNKNIFSLISDKKKKDSEEIFNINLDKIFTDEHKNSFIYKQTCSEVIKECLNGLSYCFISHGETVSEKLITLIGDIAGEENDEQYKGIFPRTLFDLYTYINDNKKNHNDISLNFSFICINNNKLIDLNHFIEKDITDFKGQNFLKEGKSIQNDKNLINYIKKLSVNNYNNILSFVDNILSLFIKLENENNDDFFSTSHIVLILYINNNKGENISTLSFILLNGSEKINITQNNNKNDIYYYNNLNNEQKKKSISAIKCSITTQNTYNSIIYLIKQNKKYNMNNNFKKEEEQELEHKINIKESKYISNLTAILYNICFNWRIKNIKYIIFGNIYPNNGYYKSVKDSIFFLYEFYKIFHKINLKLIKEDEKSGNNSDTEEYEILNSSLFELDYQLKQQNQTIIALNDLLKKRNEKIFLIEQEYNFQVEQLKNSLGFVGDINILLSGNEYTPEAQRAKNIRESKSKINYLNDKIKELEKQLKKSNDEIKKYKLTKEISNSDVSMIKYIQYVKGLDENKKNERKNNAFLLEKLNDTEKELNNKNIIINELKKDLNIKNNLIKNFSPLINLNYNSITNDKNESKNNENENEKKKEVVKKKEKKVIDNQSNNYIEINLEKIKNNYKHKFKVEKDFWNNAINEKENKIEKLKNEINNLSDNIKNLEGIIEEKDKEIYQLNQINDYRLSELKIYQNEYLKYNELTMNIFNNYNLYFLKKSKDNISLVTLQNKVEEFNKFMKETQNDINHYTFPKLHTILESKNKLSINYKTIITRNNKSKLHISKNRKKLEEEVVQSPLTPRINDKHSKIYNLMNNFTNTEKKDNNIDINILSQEELEKMSRYKIIEYCLGLNEKIYEDKKKIEKFDKINMENEENKKQINYLNFNLKKIKNNLDEQMKINNNNKIVIISQNRTIEKYNQNINLMNYLKKDDKDNVSLSLSPQKKKKTMHFNKSQINLKTNNDILFNNLYNKEFSSPHKKYNIFSKNKKELHIPIDYYSINSDNHIVDKKNLYNSNFGTKFSSNKTTTSKSNTHKNDISMSYINFHSQN